MTLEEVLLVFGGHVGLLIYSLQEDGGRVVGVDVDVMQNRLGQGEDVDDRPLQDVTGFRKELIEAPALSLFDLQDVGQDGHQLALQPHGQSAGDGEAVAPFQGTIFLLLSP